jgi:hypothetical protein
MSTRRSIQNTPGDLSLKDATDQLIDAVGGPSKAEGYSRLDRRRASDYVGANTDAFVPADIVVALEKRAVGSPGWPQVTREQARQTGHVLVRLPAAGTDVTGDIHRCAAQHAKEASDVTARILLGVSHGKLTRKIVRDLDLVRECREALEQMAQLTAMVAAIDGEDDS